MFSKFWGVTTYASINVTYFVATWHLPRCHVASWWQKLQNGHFIMILAKIVHILRCYIIIPYSKWYLAIWPPIARDLTPLAATGWPLNEKKVIHCIKIWFAEFFAKLWGVTRYALINVIIWPAGTCQDARWQGTSQDARWQQVSEILNVALYNDSGENCAHFVV